MKDREDGGDIGGYTRLLSGEHHDWLSDYIPTVVVKRLPTSVTSEYTPADRTLSLFLWVFSDHFRDIPEDYVMFLDPDHILMNPVPNWATPSCGVH